MKRVLSLDIVNTITHQIVQIALSDGKPPISIAVYDNHGFLMFFSKMDGAPLRSIELAKNKAYTAARMGTTTEAFDKRLFEEQLNINYFCDSCLTAMPGGTPIVLINELIGAVGISGRHPKDDQELADKAVSFIIQEILE
ncbi:uncharacterized protein, possibly involved in utilization of glycolate and propanediol [Desulfitobacterium dehalogenans ATCC 51507]|uniref:Uncharacterized protein, possibly involved in utilization of glycolate and propanediol n=1 Tax=Desulfitobacterium dehalogenans (strain ATCC 51507 / DSM 9161 / JW/IU-DC1) TaxID=756499 RepID=I4AE47_DESDJ|nr:heme-binding protein [Desulfitobacterium dehalogenans]AFM02232.1 uncharacterized protein, possibly involved in utilization of glycolate and propanediol [Desulfitobacterium dehalogenans ATCC 51507]